MANINMEPQWNYYGAFLKEPAKSNLMEYVKQYIGVPDDWKTYCDHMTVIYNDGSENAEEWKNNCKGLVGTLTNLIVTHIGASDRAIAVRVTGFPTNNKIPHITVAVAPGARPVESNEITNWFSVDDNYCLSAEINVVWKNRK